jgi:hypothetical protein
MIFSTKQRENRQLTTDVDCSAAPHPGPGEEELSSVTPTAFPTFTLPLRLSNRPSRKTAPESIQQQLDQVDLLSQAGEDDVCIRLD